MNKFGKHWANQSYKGVFIAGLLRAFNTVMIIETLKGGLQCTSFSLMRAWCDLGTLSVLRD